MDATLFPDASRRALLGGLAGGALLACSPRLDPRPQGSSVPPAEGQWLAWQRFANRFVADEGRVVDLTFGGKTTSEGQSYGLFFALVAGDRERFDRLLAWTEANLAGGELGSRLAGWWWGRRDDGSWGLKDRGPASDADLWMAYVLLQASQLWREPAYEAIARALMTNIAAHEIVDAGNGRAWLLPGPTGFDLGAGRYRFNPSYLPEFLLRALADADAAGPWARVWSTYREAVPRMFPAGIAPDLCIVTREGAVMPDAERGPVGSYDAIRVYLWAGVAADSGGGLVPSLRGMPPLIARFGAPPEKVDTLTGEAVAADFLPPGFAGAVLPFLAAHGDGTLLAAVQDRVARHQSAAQAGITTHYYDEALILFGTGWQERRYRVLPDGRLQVAWFR